MEKRFRETDIPYEDGQHILYINAAVDDGSEIAALMQYFKTADANDMRHGALSKRVHFLKCEEGGHQEMCDISEKIFNEGLAEGLTKGRMEGLTEGKMETARDVAVQLAVLGFTADKIAEITKVRVSLVNQWLDSRATPVQ